MSAKICVVGNKVYIPDIAAVSRHEKADSIVFVGKMDYEPNVVAVTYFTECVLPALLERHPYLRFVIAGAFPDKRVQKLARMCQHVTVTGYVESMEPYWREATIVVSPMLTGAGIQNKIIQAMAYGCCVITTSIGAEGLDIRRGEIAIVDGDHALIQTVLDLLENRRKRVEMGKLAREYVIQNLSEDVIQKQFWQFINNPFFDS